jgi:endonuclease YncB( thermonuclease family)
LTARAEEINGRVVNVVAGDALTIQFPSGLRVAVRLADIAAPKAEQPYGTRSRRSLAELCGGKSAIVENQGANADGYLAARVMCAGINANGEQVRRGMAWVDRRYADPTSGLLRLEADAREHRRGLWRRRHPVAPWIWQPRR